MPSHPHDARSDSRGGDRGRRRSRRQPEDMPVERAREWLSSYVYGNITVLSAAIAVSPEQIRHGAAVAAVLATGFLTFLAHVLSHVVAHGLGRSAVERESEASREMARDVLTTARPIATSALIRLRSTSPHGWGGWRPHGCRRARSSSLLHASGSSGSSCSDSAV